MSITIQTRLDEGIYRSEGGGQVVTHYEWNTGPRNLIEAARTYHRHVEETKRNRGTIGAGRSWFRIDGYVVDPFDLVDTEGGDLTMKEARSMIERAQSWAAMYPDMAAQEIDE